MLGSHNAIRGAATSKAIVSNAGTKKGSAPRAITIISCWGTTPFKTNKFKPYGGVTNPISASTTYTTPNQTGSKPNAATSGITKGRVSSSMAKESKNIPRMMYITQTMANMPYFPKGRFIINAAKTSVMPIY